MSDELQLSIIIPALNEGPNLAVLLPGLHEVLKPLGISYEVLIVTSQPDELTLSVAERAGARVLEQREPGYGGALLTGFSVAHGRYLLTMDADLSHLPTFIRTLWHRRTAADVVIASRYVPGGSTRTSMSRYVLSKVLNAVLRRGLSLPVHDLSSGFRLYRASVVRDLACTARDFDLLQEVLVRAHAEGWRIEEVPFAYKPRRHGSSHARVLRVGRAYLRTFWPLWRLRNSIMAADYDDRAYDSQIFFQRYWQRSRFRYVTELTAGQGPVLDVGCGSSRIIGALPPGSVAVDILLRKLRYARKFATALVCASAFSLPLRDATFPCVLCSQVIEHVPKDSPIIDELCRVLAPGGRLVLGTPDYAHWEWRLIEKIYGTVVPGGYAEEHISHYTRRELIEMFERRGFKHEATRYILRGEVILALRKME
jgi:dolichol-phosphate mannosyltransferase